MRPRVPWMNETDDTILEYLSQLEINGGQYVTQSPTAVWVNLSEQFDILEKSQSTVARRMQHLEQMDLLDKADEKRAYYRITPKGLRYLEGDIDREELIEPTE